MWALSQTKQAATEPGFIASTIQIAAIIAIYNLQLSSACVFHFFIKTYFVLMGGDRLAAREAVSALPTAAAKAESSPHSWQQMCDCSIQGHRTSHCSEGSSDASQFILRSGLPAFLCLTLCRMKGAHHFMHFFHGHSMLSILCAATAVFFFSYAMMGVDLPIPKDLQAARLEGSAMWGLLCSCVSWETPSISSCNPIWVK